MADGNANELAERSGPGWRRTLAWILLGVLCGVGLAVLFVAYGQPALLLEQMNLRYCG